LLKFFLNSNTTSYLRKLESEFGESTNSIRLELNRLEKAGLLTSRHLGNKKMYSANTKHPLFSDLNNILKKFVGIDSIIEKIAMHIGDLKTVHLTGCFAQGIDSNTIDLTLTGDKLDRIYIRKLVKKAEKLISRKINFQTFSNDKDTAFPKDEDSLLIWKEERKLL
jgi:DNA-binding transcriptional ArsR family regulator